MISRIISVISNFFLFFIRVEIIGYTFLFLSDKVNILLLATVVILCLREWARTESFACRFELPRLFVSLWWGCISYFFVLRVSFAFFLPISSNQCITTPNKIHTADSAIMKQGKQVVVIFFLVRSLTPSSAVLSTCCKQSSRGEIQCGLFCRKGMVCCHFSYLKLFFKKSRRRLSCINYYFTKTILN